MSKKILIPLAMILTTLPVCVPVLALRADTVVTGGGWIIDQAGQKANFAFDVDSNLEGQVQYDVPGKWHMHSTEIAEFRHRNPLEPTWVYITGTCRWKDLITGLWYTDFFVWEVEDLGEPGHKGDPEDRDWFKLQVGDPEAPWYVSMLPHGQRIDGGNIQHLGLEGPFIP